MNVFGRNADKVLRDLSHAGARDQCVIVHCDNKTATRLRNNCARENVVRGRCAVYTPRRLPGDIFSGKRNDISEQMKKKKITVQSRMMVATNPSFYLTSSRRSAASVMTKMSASSWRK